jgi:outer membrane protein assembly factor BamB
MNGVVYVSSHGLFAFNASTGEQFWRITGIMSSPIVYGDMVYTISGAFDVATESQIWSIDGRGGYAGANGYYYTFYRNS